MSRDVAALRHAMARMLYDPAYVRRVHAGPLPGLVEAERALLLQVDRRAWGTDRYRRSRAVQALIEEYPVTAAVLGVKGVDAFFSSEAFGRVLTKRGSLALDFGSWAEPRAGAVARLERSVAAARRGERSAGPGLVTRPGVEPLMLPDGVLGFYAAQREALGADPVAALAQGRPKVNPPAQGEGEDALLIERDDQGQVQVGGGSPALVRLLAFLTTPRSREAALGHARRLGCDPGEDAEVVDGLIEDGLVQVRG
jgi:hypothetical protein